MRFSPRQFASILVAGMLVTVGAAGCVEKSTPTVTLDIYSGQENPTWALSADTRDALVDAIDGLREGSADIPTGSGFRGFRLSALTTTWGDEVPVTVLEGAVVLDPDSSAPTVLVDVDSRALALLVEDAKGHVDKEALHAVTNEP